MFPSLDLVSLDRVRCGILWTNWVGPLKLCPKTPQFALLEPNYSHSRVDGWNSMEMVIHPSRTHPFQSPQHAEATRSKCRSQVPTTTCVRHHHTRWFHIYSGQPTWCHECANVFPSKYGVLGFTKTLPGSSPKGRNLLSPFVIMELWMLHTTA